MSQRVYNFSAGPATLPSAVLKEAHQEFLSYQGQGMSVLEMSHRSKPIIAVFEAAEANIRELLNIPKDYHVLFLQGGARMQFAMIPMNLRAAGQSADYVLTGSWGEYAIKEAKRLGDVRLPWDGSADNFTRVPKQAELDLDSQAAYLHFTSNETIQGVEFSTEPESGSVPLICDMSSDFMSRPVDVSKYGLIYAGAQKNAGPAGATIVIIKDELLKRIPGNLPDMLNYQVHVDKSSMYNTPPVFSVYIISLVTQWLREEMGGLDAMYQQNQAKADQLYQAIDGSDGFYQAHAEKASRSLMNVTWRLPSEELESAFATAALEQGLSGLKGHRSVGGIRASIYNAMEPAGVDALCQFMSDFKAKQA